MRTSQLHPGLRTVSMNWNLRDLYIWCLVCHKQFSWQRQATAIPSFCADSSTGSHEPQDLTGFLTLTNLTFQQGTNTMSHQFLGERVDAQRII